MKLDDALREVDRRLDLANTLSESLREAALVLDGVEGASGLADTLWQAEEVVRVSEADEKEDPDDHEKPFTGMAESVAPILQLLTDEARKPVEEKWEALWKAVNPEAGTSAPDLDVPDGYVGKKRKRSQVLYRSEVMAKLAEEVDPEALGELLLAMLKDGKMGMEVWRVLKEGMEEIQEPVDEEDGQS